MHNVSGVFFVSVSFDLDSSQRSARWVKMNVNMTGVYRVHYDEANWRALINQLATDHTVHL